MSNKELLREELDRHIRNQIDNKKVDAILVEQQLRQLAVLENERYTKINKGDNTSQGSP